MGVVWDFLWVWVKGGPMSLRVSLKIRMIINQVVIRISFPEMFRISIITLKKRRQAPFKNRRFRISSSPHRIFQWFRLVLPESGESLQSFQLCTLVLPFYRAVRKKLPQVLGCPRFSNNIPGWWFRNPIPNHRLDVLYRTTGETTNCTNLNWFSRRISAINSISSNDHSTLSIQVCPKKGINPTVLLWGWDWDHQTYSREGYGSLGQNQSKPRVLGVETLKLRLRNCWKTNHLPGPSSRGAILKLQGMVNWHPLKRNHVRHPDLKVLGSDSKAAKRWGTKWFFFHQGFCGTQRLVAAQAELVGIPRTFANSWVGQTKIHESSPNFLEHKKLESLRNCWVFLFSRCFFVQCGFFTTLCGWVKERSSNFGGDPFTCPPKKTNMTMEHDHFQQGIHRLIHALVFQPVMSLVFRVGYWYLFSFPRMWQPMRCCIQEEKGCPTTTTTTAPDFDCVPRTAWKHFFFDRSIGYQDTWPWKKRLY